MTAASGAYVLWGFNMSAALTGWMALRLISGIILLCVAAAILKRHREMQRGYHQWPTPGGRLYDQWMKLSADSPQMDYYTWLADLKGWCEPWATWAEWSGAKRPIGSVEARAQADPLTARAIQNINSTTLAEEEARQKSNRLLGRLNQAASQARERREK